MQRERERERAIFSLYMHAALLLFPEAQLAYDRLCCLKVSVMFTSTADVGKLWAKCCLLKERSSSGDNFSRSQQAARAVELLLNYIPCWSFQSVLFCGGDLGREVVNSYFENK